MRRGGSGRGGRVWIFDAFDLSLQQHPPAPARDTNSPLTQGNGKSAKYRPPPPMGVCADPVRAPVRASILVNPPSVHYPHPLLLIGTDQPFFILVESAVVNEQGPAPLADKLQ